ncbi:MAG TPA: hypothetical protein VK184_19715 [Nostocaceae cyanobacterium]|nr:hypothetical protein [Nostocaceae cyanobacterium]
MDVITTAILTCFSNLAVKDCYQTLINALKKKLGGQSDLISAVNELEKKPNSESRKATVKEEVENAKVNDDLELVKLAQDLLAQIKAQPGGQQLIHQTVSHVKYAATSGSGTASIGNITEQEASKNK